MCDLLAAEQKIPAPVLSVVGLECILTDGFRLAGGDWAKVDLYLITTSPRPLKLLAKVVTIEEGKGVLSFVDLSDGV